jgi:hypothetical protein
VTKIGDFKFRVCCIRAILALGGITFGEKTHMTPMDFTIALWQACELCRCKKKMLLLTI